MLSPFDGTGEAAEARATSGKRGSKTEPRFLSPVHFGYPVTASEEEPGITTPTEMVTVGAWPGGHCSYNISLSQIS